VRKRMKNLEDLEGTSECVRVLKQLQVRTTTGKHTTMNTMTTATNKPLKTIPEEEEMETEEDILQR
jgi:hypothetical protein